MGAAPGGTGGRRGEGAELSPAGINGRTLRLLRGVQSVRRQAYVEFDLPGMLEEQRFEDFEALYRLLHRTR